MCRLIELCLLNGTREYSIMMSLLIALPNLAEQPLPLGCVRTPLRCHETLRNAKKVTWFFFKVDHPLIRKRLFVELQHWVTSCGKWKWETTQEKVNCKCNCKSGIHWTCKTFNNLQAAKLEFKIVFYFRDFILSYVILFVIHKTNSISSILHKRRAQHPTYTLYTYPIMRWICCWLKQQQHQTHCIFLQLLKRCFYSRLIKGPVCFRTFNPQNSYSIYCYKQHC